MNTTFLQHFDSIFDPRIKHGKKHNLLDIILLTITAVVSGLEGWGNSPSLIHERHLDSCSQINQIWQLDNNLLIHSHKKGHRSDLKIRFASTLFNGVKQYVVQN